MTKTFPRGFIERTNEEYAAWCKTFYNPSALDHRGMPGLHGLWAWQEQERRKVKEWQPIETAPKDNKRPLYLARIDAQGKILELDHGAIWEYWQESWEMPHINGYAWASANGIEEPTHWAYQDEGPPPSDGIVTADPPWSRDNERTLTLLLLCGGHDVPVEAIAGWTDDQCKQAEDWAARSHIHASDNDDVEVPPMPDHVKAHPPKPITDRPNDLSLWGN